ncbi:hypothetical protein GGI23_000001 [Coemansia sp. RSA 2559]|nr:hypothetical protein GGI23_000001 [Coemansia sp. RSA 2559]KAJ2869759.1 hypothetical protein GGI22_000001 [Coemansia erecta]
MRGYNILAIASVAAFVSAEMCRPHLYRRQNGIANPGLQPISSSPNTGNLGNGEQSNAFAAPTATNNMQQPQQQQTNSDLNGQQMQSQQPQMQSQQPQMQSQQPQMQTDGTVQTADSSGSQSQSLPSTLFDNLPSFLGVTLPGQSHASAPTATSGPISADSDAARASVVSSTSGDKDSTLGSSSATANNLNVHLAAILALAALFM